MTQMPLRVRQRMLVTTLVALMALGAGGAAAQSVSPSPAAGADAGPTLDQQLAAARTEITALTVERDRLQDLLSAFDTLYDPMEADRQLLVELRKPIPDVRDSAEAYLERLRRLSVVSDPARLGQPSSRLLETAPIFLDWRDGTYTSQGERDAAFVASGASGFSTDFDDLQKAILLTVANRLDALLTLRDRIR